MLTGLFTGALGLFGGAKRWLNAETLKALSFALVAVVGLVGLVLLFNAGGSGAVAKRDLMWSGNIERLNASRRTFAEAKRVASEKDSADERMRLSAEVEAAIMRAAALERELETLKAQSGDPVIYPRALARSMR